MSRGLGDVYKRQQWHRIPCAYKAKSSQYALRTIEEIHNDVYSVVENLLP